MAGICGSDVCSPGTCAPYANKITKVLLCGVNTAKKDTKLTVLISAIRYTAPCYVLETVLGITYVDNRDLEMYRIETLRTFLKTSGWLLKLFMDEQK